MGLQRSLRSRRGTRGGFSQLELLIALTVLVLAVLGFSMGLVSTGRLTVALRERTLAIEQARRVLEELQDATFSEVFARYDATAADNPGLGSSPGASFAVEGLTATEDDPDGVVGEIVFPVSGGQLREDAVMRALGMPRDLNGDGGKDAANHAVDYQLLPVLVRVRWRSQGGPMNVELRTVLCQR